MTERPLTRRELRELERSRNAGSESVAIEAMPDQQFVQGSQVDFYEPEAIASASLPFIDERLGGNQPLNVASFEAPAAVEPEVVDLFPRSGPIDIVTDTNSIVIEMPKDITNSTLVIADSGVVLTTGSITLPNLKADTGEISVIAAAEAADTALNKEKRDYSVEGIQPLPARVHMRSRKRSSVFPTRLRKGMGQVYMVLFSAVMTAAVLGILVAAYMLGIIHL
jgi:hypothetical protein